MTSRSAMQPEPAVALGSSQRVWVAELMSYAQDHAGVRVVGTVLSSREAVDQPYDVLLIDDTTSFLTKRLVDRVQLLRRVVIGVYESSHGDTGRHKLLDMGVDAVIDAESPPKDFMARIRYVSEQRLVDRDFAEIVSDEPDPFGQLHSGPGPEPVSEGRPGKVIAVTGSNGVTEVAVGLAAGLASRLEHAVAVDLDTIAPSLAQRLDLELSPNVLTVIESQRHSGNLDDRAVQRLGGFDVITGLPTAREWEACSPDDAADVIGELAGIGATVVVRIDRNLEDLSPFGGRSGRFGVARRIVSEADVLVVVGDPSPVGVTSLLSWVGEARALTDAPVHVVLNHCGRSLYQRGEVLEEISRSFRAESVNFLPDDQQVRKAAWQGSLPPAGRFTKAVAALVETVIDISVTSVRSPQ